MKALLTAATCALLAVPAAGLASGAGARGLSPRPALVTAHALTLRSTPGTYCVTGRPRNGTSAGVCADYAYPLRTRGRLPVDGGDRVALRFRHNPRIFDQPRSVRVSPLRVHDGHIDAVSTAVVAKAVNGHPRRWSVVLAADLEGANRLDVAVRYRQGDADFWAGIRPTG
jgi:hypothetical protein